MDGVGQQNDVGLRGWIDPYRCSGKAGVAVGADGQEIAAVRGERRINVPAKTAQHWRRRRLLGLRHLLDRERRKNPSAAIQQGLRELSQIVGRGKQSRMAGHAAHAPGCRIMHHTAQHVLVLVVLRGRDFRPPRRRRQEARMEHFQRRGKCGAGNIRPATRLKPAPPVRLAQ